MVHVLLQSISCRYRLLGTWTGAAYAYHPLISSYPPRLVSHAGRGGLLDLSPGADELRRKL